MLSINIYFSTSFPQHPQITTSPVLVFISSNDTITPALLLDIMSCHPSKLGNIDLPVHNLKTTVSCFPMACRPLYNACQIVQCGCHYGTNVDFCLVSQPTQWSPRWSWFFNIRMFPTLLGAPLALFPSLFVGIVCCLVDRDPNVVFASKNDTMGERFNSSSCSIQVWKPM